MSDPLAEVVTLLQPGARFSKVVNGAGSWGVRRSEIGQPFYCVILEGSCRLAVVGQKPIALEEGDFVLIPAAYDFTMSSLKRVTSKDFDTAPVQLSAGEFRVGIQSGPPDVRLLVGHFAFGSPDAALLVSLLPQLVYIRAQKRLATLVQLVIDESRAQRPARDVVLARLLEIMMIEALRSTAGAAAPPGLLRGLADERLALAIRRMHESPTQPWTVAQLAKEAALSRSAFFERFSRAVGVAPIEYLLAWRMAMARQLLRRNECSVAEVAQRVGYSSGSTFSVAFTRHVGMSPTRYAQEQMRSANAAMDVV
ncbi:AraC family transcriptional regulator [Paraburkholderia edwinii]|uniref:AraC family transcriptional regulator n=1 Tax=Paraburkholderia edwinii TaxID=2861782 RepID=A0ABX8V1Q3_9BURK|nr:AraC family transcriptional regulator [Paraburkholderia edwinii]QYD73015.1 AraC family transcriptional regulator [Paraburkholderia edwinii]